MSTPPGDPVYHCPFCDGVLTLKIDGGKFMACEDDHCPLGHLDLRLSRLQAVQPSPLDPVRMRQWKAVSSGKACPTCGFHPPMALPKEGA